MFEMVKVPIGLIGGICSGKDTVGEILTKCFDYRRVAFGDKIRTVWEMHLVSDEAAFMLLTMYSPKFSDRREEFLNLVKDVVDKRTFLQKVGTWGRKVDNHVWIRQVGITFPDRPQQIVCTDVRRKAEFEYLKACGFHFMFIDAPLEVRKQRFNQRDSGMASNTMFSDISESEIPLLKPLCDAVIVNDGDKSELVTSVLCALQKINKKWGNKYEI